MQTKDDIKEMAQTFREAERGKKRERRRTVSKILDETDQDSAGINSRKGNRHE